MLIVDIAHSHVHQSNIGLYHPVSFVNMSVKLGPIHRGSQVLVPKSLEVNMGNLNHGVHGSWDLPLHGMSQVLSLKYDIVAYMATLLGGEAWGLC